jgi:tetratricopeptide (TPR) repeat protein
MKPLSKFAIAILLATAFAAATAQAGLSGATYPGLEVSTQQGPGRGPITLPRDPELEKQSYHNLEVAKYYFYKRKPDRDDKEGWARLNKAVESRLQEIIDVNPHFGRMDDVYFMLGEVYKRMSDLDKAVEYWTKAQRETSDEKLKSDVQKRLDEAKSQDKAQKKG